MHNLPPGQNECLNCGLTKEKIQQRGSPCRPRDQYGHIFKKLASGQISADEAQRILDPPKPKPPPKPFALELDHRGQLRIQGFGSRPPQYWIDLLSHKEEILAFIEEHKEELKELEAQKKRRIEQIRQRRIDLYGETND